MYKIDLHTHSIASPDGGISISQYQKAIHENMLDIVAITDHNRIDLALHMHQLFGQKIIVGEEIMTIEGEIIGLYLSEVIRPGLSATETIQQIKAQGGIVYVPHPFETIRKAISPKLLDDIAGQIDLLEIYNGRAFAQKRSHQAVVWAKLNNVTGVASSDAHGIGGLGNTYTSTSELPTRNTILDLLASGSPIVSNPTVKALLYPKYHRLRKKLQGQA